jgi:hypothetical protein
MIEVWKEYRLENATQEHSITQVCGALYFQNREISGEWTFIFTGKVHPGLVVQAEIKRKRVMETVTFQVMNRREIRYEHGRYGMYGRRRKSVNTTSQETAGSFHLSAMRRKSGNTWERHSRIDFVLKDSDVADATENEGRAAGGDGPDGWVWPPVGPAPEGREHGTEIFALVSRKDSLAYESDSSGTDGQEDVEGSGFHKLAKRSVSIRHAIDNLKQPVTVMLKGRYEWDGGWEEVVYQRNMLERTAPEDMIEPFAVIHSKVREVAMRARATELPLPIQGLAVTRDQLDVEVGKVGNRLHTVDERLDQKGMPPRPCPLKFKAQFPEGLSVVFGT